MCGLIVIDMFLETSSSYEHVFAILLEKKKKKISLACIHDYVSDASIMFLLPVFKNIDLLPNREGFCEEFVSFL